MKENNHNLRLVPNAAIIRALTGHYLPALCLAAALVLALPPQAHAIIFDSTGDTNYNTHAPSGALANSGWQFEGFFGGFLGTAIAPHYFLTARHIGGNTNWGFFLDGTNYHPTTFYDDPSPGSDGRFLLSAGNGITPDTPLESLRALFEEAYSYGQTKNQVSTAKDAPKG